MNADSQRKRIMSFNTWLAHACDKSGIRTLQVIHAYFSAVLCVLCAFAVKIYCFKVKVCYFKAAKMRSRIASIEPTPATFRYFGAPGTPLFAQLE